MHRMLANSEVQVASQIVVGTEVSGSVEGQSRLRGRRQIGRSTDKPGHVLRDCVQHLGGRIAAGNAFGIGREGRNVFVPAVRKRAALHLVELIGKLWILLLILPELIVPGSERL